MAKSVRSKTLLPRLKALVTFQRLKHTLAQGETSLQRHADVERFSSFVPGWKKMDARTFGITRSVISSPALTVLKILQGEGFEAYLVGGCVRDLILKKIPKDFDVITTATLKQIRRKFYRAEIVGRRFPICRVHVKGSVIEVSSFETVAKDAKDKEKFLFSQMPKGCNTLDLTRWRNSMHRDFTINSLFLDPFMNGLYDYANGMNDLRSLKLRTLVPAQLSFKEDCARILRGLRIAARLSLSFSKDTETAIRKLSPSIINLSKSRIMMELNYMLSYGAAEPSISLLRRFNLLEILLPFHAAYFAEQSKKQTNKGSVMLFKLFFNLDQLVSCDRPCDCSLWVGLLAFHMALVHHPQHPLVVLTFASVLYHGKWAKGVEVASQYVQSLISFAPEISRICDAMSDAERSRRVTSFALLVQASIDVLTETDCLSASMARFPDLPCSDLVFVSKKMGREVAQLFDVLVYDVKSYQMERRNAEIDYNSLGKGDVSETRYVLGKIIMDTLGCGVAKRDKIPEPSHLKNCDHLGKDDKKRGSSSFLYELVEEISEKQKFFDNISDQETTKKQKTASKPEEKGERQIDMRKPRKVVNEHQKVLNSEMGCLTDTTKNDKKLDVHYGQKKSKLRLELMAKRDKLIEDRNHPKRDDKHSMVEIKNQQNSTLDGHLSEGRSTEKEEVLKHSDNVLHKLENNDCHVHVNGLVSGTKEKHKQELVKEDAVPPKLSSLFR